MVSRCFWVITSRGTAIRDVLDRLVARKRTNRTVFLKGNHETYITEFMANPPLLEDWQRLGGLDPHDLWDYTVDQRERGRASATRSRL